MEFSIPLNSHINTSDDYIIKDLDTQEKDVLDKKNTLMYKSVLSPMYTKSESKVFTTSGHTLHYQSKKIIDENGRSYAIDNEWCIEHSIDISNLWSGELTSAIYKNDVVFSVWKGEAEYTIVVSDVNNNILNSLTTSVDGNALYFNVKLANYTKAASIADTDIYLVEQVVTATPSTRIKDFRISWNSSVGAIAVFQVRNNLFNYLTGKDLYVLRAKQGSTVYTFVGTDDTDLDKRYTFRNGVLLYQYWGCLGSNGLLTGEPVIMSINNRNTGLLSSKTFSSTPVYHRLDNGIVYTQQINTNGTDQQDINTMDGLESVTVTTPNGEAIWGTGLHTRVGTNTYCCGIDLEANIPLLLSPNYDETNVNNGNLKSSITPLSSAKFVAASKITNAAFEVEQVDFSDGWGNFTWSNGTASITNGCNPFPYKYFIMNRAESKGRYWDYGPGWARCYFRQGVITGYDDDTVWYRGFTEKWPTSIISFGLSSTNGANCVRQEYLDPVYLVPNSDNDSPNTKVKTGGWQAYWSDSYNYYKFHAIDGKPHVWVNFIGADNLGDHTLLSTIPFNVDIVPELNLKDQYFGLQYMSTSMKGTLLTSASVNKSSNSMVFIPNESNASLFSNGLVLVGKKNGNVKLTKISDYLYRTNTLTGNNLFIDDKEGFYGQRGFIPYNGEEVITTDSIKAFLSPVDDNTTDGNDTYYSGSGYNVMMTDMKKRAVSYMLPAFTFQMSVNSEQTEDFSFQLSSNKKEITKPLIVNQFTYKDDPVDHFYTHSLDTTDIKYQTGKKLESTASSDAYTNWFGIPTYDIDKENTTWYTTASVYFYPMGIASPVKGINYLSSTVDMTDNYSVRLYRTQNVTFPIYNPTTEVYKGSTIFTIYGYNYSFDGQSIYYLGSGDTTSESSFACYALGMQFLANSGTEAYFYSPFEKRIYLFTGSNTLQIADSLSRMSEIIDSIYSSCEQILYLLDSNGNVIAKSQNDMAVIANVSTDYHFEGTDSGMILANDWSYIKYRLWKTDETEWLPIEYETEFLGKNDSLFKISAVDITFYKGQNDTVKGNLDFEIMFDKTVKNETVPFKITASDWENSMIKKVRFVPKNNTAKGFKFGISSSDYIYIANVAVIIEEISKNTNASIHK